MKKKEFIVAVQFELDTIKEKATKEEIGMLDIDSLDKSDEFKCIYGQMTGDCGSDRAKQIMPKSIDWMWLEEGSYMGVRKGEVFTALELYLFEVEKSKHGEIIQYLTGEIKAIDLVFEA